MARKIRTAVKSVEVWEVHPSRVGAKGSTKVEVVRNVVRVPRGGLGPNGQRPGTFNGATNFPQDSNRAALADQSRPLI